MRIDSSTCAVFGYGLVGQACLSAVCELGMQPVAVYTHVQGGDLWHTNLEAMGAQAGAPVILDADFGDPEEVAYLGKLKPDILLSFYYKNVLPRTVLDIAPLGGLNLHGSPLPAYRGRVPVNWMVLKGETTGGATLHQMRARPDAGAILGTRTFPIGPTDSSFDLLCNVKRAGVELVRECLPAYIAGEMEPQPQQGEVSKFGGRSAKDGEINWSAPADEVLNLIRAVTRPYPGAFTDLEGGKRLMIWWAEPGSAHELAPGEMLLEGDVLHVGTGTGSLRCLDFNLQGVPAGIYPAALPSVKNTR